MTMDSNVCADNDHSQCHSERIEESLTRIKKPFQIKHNFIYAKCKVVVYNYKKEDPRNIELNTIREKLDLAYKNIADFITKDYVVYESAMDSIIEAGIELEKDLVQLYLLAHFLNSGSM